MAPQLTAAAVGHARAEASLGQAEAARKELEAALHAHPQDPLIEAELGHLELGAHALQPALIHLNDAWKAHPQEARLGFDDARALLLSGKPEAALAVLRSLHGEEANAQYHLELSQVYRALHRLADMQAELAQMRRINQRKQEDLHFVPPSTYIQ
jgi:predicted Zn-dependent protease